MNVYCYYAVVNLMLQGSRLQIYPEQWPLSPQSNPIRYQLFILRGCMGHSPSQECLPWSTFPSSSCSSLHLLCYFHHPLHLSMFLPPFSSIFLPISVLLMEIACCQRIITGHPENTVVCTYNDGISSSSHLSEDIDKQASVQDCIFCIVVAKLNHGTRFVFLYAVPPPCAIQIMQSGRSWQYNFNQCKKKKNNSKEKFSGVKKPTNIFLALSFWFTVIFQSRKYTGKLPRQENKFSSAVQVSMEYEIVSWK